MPPPHPLYLAWLAEPAADGERRSRAPLHLTLVPPFAGDEAAVLGALRATAAGRAPVAAAATGTARLGARRVPVVLVAPDDGLRDLHDALMDAVGAAGVDLAHTRHVRDGFTPHVSVRPREDGPPPIAPGDPLVVDHVALLRRGDGTVVVGRAPLGVPGPPGR
ncbi:MAG TPA: 2'-5' RNA ligase family protein [Miltoncostaeaceae bacterium]|nr:2'-5' RNA ligase family protein [Miltoncostaeaceae bacterium]